MLLSQPERRKLERLPLKVFVRVQIPGTQASVYAETRDVSAPTDCRRLQNWIAGHFVMVLREVADQRDCYEIQHDRVDYFVRSEARFQNSGYSAPDGAHSNRRNNQNEHTADDSNRDAVFTTSPRTVYSRRLTEPMSPTRTTPE